MKTLSLLKLGGSLITDKSQPRSARRDIIKRISEEIARACQADPDLRLILGHGSGSFGHFSAHRHGTRQGVHTLAQWRGFVEVWQDARALNQLLVETLSQTGLPIIAFPPSAMVKANNGMITSWNLSPLRSALQAGLIPLVNGDVIFDRVRGGTILSTEELFFYLARKLKPDRILLSGIEDGVWADFPNRQYLIPQITPSNLPQMNSSLGGSLAIDVTGGMLKKVENMIDLVNEVPGLEVQIFSGAHPELLYNVLLGAKSGTTICI